MDMEKLKVGMYVERKVSTGKNTEDEFTWVKGSFGRVIDLEDSSYGVKIQLATAMFNNGFGPIASWEKNECKIRSKEWVEKKIKEITNEMTKLLEE